MARRENVELFRVISNQALEEIASQKPQNKVDLLEIKGIKEKKYAKYGKEILAMVRGELPLLRPSGTSPRAGEEDFVKIFEVGEYLDFLIEKLLGTEAKVKGEISDLKFWRKTISFDLKDEKDGSSLKCFMWQNKYEISGVQLEEGIEITVLGGSSIRKQWGQLNFEVEIIELVGEGALKKAYDELKKKLDLEGLFLPERKRKIRRLINSIGIITSIHGDAVIDFRANIGNYGFKIKLFDSFVEGKQAVFSLIEGIKFFNKKYPDLDAIVITRGGGSLESLQAFNTEALVREVINSRIPVLAGIGHEKDVPLVALAADLMVSTPTAAALEIRRPWDEAIHGVESSEKYILNAFQNILVEKKSNILETERILSGMLADIFERFRRARENLKNSLVKIKMTIDQDRNLLASAGKKLSANYSRLFSNFVSVLKSLAEKIALHNPERQLKLGYSLVFSGKKILRSVKDIKLKDKVDIRLQDGDMETEIIKITNQ